jgi:hypothetical protein
MFGILADHHCADQGLRIVGFAKGSVQLGGAGLQSQPGKFTG